MIPANPIVANNAPPVSRPAAIAPEQLRAARGLLGWSRSELAKEAGMSAETVKNIEHGIYEPKKGTLAALVGTFARRGIQFVHYETLVTSSDGNGTTSSLQALSYAGAVRVTAFVPEIREEDHD